MRRLTSAVLAALLVTACSTQTTLRTLPRGANVVVDGRTMRTRPPYRVKATKIPFGIGETLVEVSEEGYATQFVPLDQVMDDTCLAMTATWSIVGGILLVVPILGLPYLPWCTEFGQDEYVVELEPEWRRSTVRR